MKCAIEIIIEPEPQKDESKDLSIYTLEEIIEELEKELEYEF